MIVESDHVLGHESAGEVIAEIAAFASLTDLQYFSCAFGLNLLQRYGSGFGGGGPGS